MRNFVQSHRAETICAAGGAAITLESGEGRQVPPPQGGMPVTSLAAPAPTAEKTNAERFYTC
jgi:hypothetical protein